MIRSSLIAAAVLLTASAGPARAGLTLPPSGDNQSATVTQAVGPVTVSIEYSSPRVTLGGKNDRRGQIWGKLVPYGLVDLGFGTCKQCPWRAGANMNTVFAVSHDVKVQGATLPAGRYGLHMIPGPEEWTIIFSKNSTSWGSFFYDPKEDALRVTTKPGSSDYHEWLTYEFVEREPARATVALKWEELQVPFSVTVDNAPALYVDALRKEMRNDNGFVNANIVQAAQYCLDNKVNLAEALTWAQNAVSGQFVGVESFNTLMLLSRLEAANGRTTEAAKTAEKAMSHPSVRPIDLHLLGRSLLAEGKKDEALKVFQANARRFPDQWPVHVGLMRGYSAMGDLKKALSEARLALKQAPDEANRKNLQNAVKTLEGGKPVE